MCSLFLVSSSFTSRQGRKYRLSGKNDCVPLLDFVGSPCKGRRPQAGGHSRSRVPHRPDPANQLPSTTIAGLRGAQQVVVHGDIIGIDNARRATRLVGLARLDGFHGRGPAGAAGPIHRLLRPAREQPRSPGPGHAGAGHSAHRGARRGQCGGGTARWPARRCASGAAASAFQTTRNGARPSGPGRPALAWRPLGGRRAQ